MNIYIRRLADSVGFFQAYQEEVASKKHKKCLDAYEAVETLRENNFGFRKYKTYKSFRVALCQFRKTSKSFLTPPATQDQRI